MGALLANVLPLALGAAVSPTLLALQLLVLTGPNRPRARAWALAAGAALVLAGVAVVGLTVLNHVAAAHHAHRSWRDAIILFVGAALLGGLAARTLLTRPTSGEAHASRTTARLQRAATPWFVGVGAVGMATNFSTLVLFVPGLHEITRSAVGLLGRSVAFALLYVVALAPVLAPVGLVTVFGDRAQPALDATHRFVTANSRRIGLGVELVFAAYLLWRGFAELP